MRRSVSVCVAVLTSAAATEILAGHRRTTSKSMHALEHRIGHLVDHGIVLQAVASLDGAALAKAHPGVNSGRPALVHAEVPPTGRLGQRSESRSSTRLSRDTNMLLASGAPQNEIQRPQSIPVPMWRSAKEIKKIQSTEYKGLGSERFFSTIPANRLFNEVMHGRHEPVSWFDHERLVQAIGSPEADVDSYERVLDSMQSSSTAVLERLRPGESPSNDAGFMLLRNISKNSFERELADILEELRYSLVDGIRRRWQNNQVRDVGTFKRELNRDILNPTHSLDDDPLVGIMARYLPRLKHLLVRFLESRSEGKAYDVCFADLRNQALRLDAPVTYPHVHTLLPKIFFAANGQRERHGKCKQYAIWIPLVKQDARKVLATMAKPSTRAISDDGRLCVETFYSRNSIYSAEIMESDSDPDDALIYTVAPPGDIVLLEAGEALHFGLVDGAGNSPDSLASEHDLHLLLSSSSLDLQFLAVELDDSMFSFLKSLLGG